MSYRITFKVKRKGTWDFKKVPLRFSRNLKTVMAGFGKEAADRIKNEMKQGGKYAANNPFWRTTKGGAPLYNTGHMADLPDYKITTTADAFVAVDVGFVREATHPESGESVQRIADMLTRGRRWKPTPGQRKAFWAKVAGSYSRDQITKRKVWINPRRNFIRGALGPGSGGRKLFNKYIKQAEAMTYRK